MDVPSSPLPARETGMVTSPSSSGQWGSPLILLGVLAGSGEPDGHAQGPAWVLGGWKEGPAQGPPTVLPLCPKAQCACRVAAKPSSLQNYRPGSQKAGPAQRLPLQGPAVESVLL